MDVEQLSSHTLDRNHPAYAARVLAARPDTLRAVAGLDETSIAAIKIATPLPGTYASLQAAAIRPGDVVLEPSAGTGMLAVMAQCALGKETAGALHLNELAATRAGLLSGLFPGCAVTRQNAEAIRDHLPELLPTVVLMNPPFSASFGVDRIRHDADLRHIRSAFSMLMVGTGLSGGFACSDRGSFVRLSAREVDAS